MRLKGVLVDKRDEWLLNRHSWTILKGHKTCYVSTTGNKRPRRLLHRVIAQAKAGELIDHRDGNGLNNRRSNIRKATQSQNQSNRHFLASNNTSGYTGVDWVSKDARWRVRVGKTVVGYVRKKRLAIAVRRAAELIAFGAFAPPCKHPYEELAGKYGSLSELRAAHCCLQGQRPGRSGIKGVHKRIGKWVAISDKKHGTKYLGVFRSRKAAAVAVAKANA